MPKIKMYTTATCAFCRAQKNFFKEHNVEYEEVAVDEDQQRAEELLEQSGQLGVPFTIITKDDGGVEKVLGFDQPRLAAALGI